MSITIGQWTPFSCTNGDLYVALGSSYGFSTFGLGRWGSVKADLYFFGNEPSLGQKSLILHLTRALLLFQILTIWFISVK